MDVTVLSPHSDSKLH